MKTSPAPLNVRKNLQLALFKSLVVPLLVLAFFMAAPHWLNHRLRTQATSLISGDSKLSNQEKNTRLENIGRLDFQQVCENCPPGFEKLHDNLVQAGIAGNFQRLRWGLMLAWLLAGGLALATVAIFVWNGQARKTSAGLIFGYQMSWKIGMAAALAKVFLLIPLLTYGTFEFSVLLTDHYYPKLLLLIVLGGLFALWNSAQILLKKVPLEFTESMSREVTPEEAPELWRAVRFAAERLKTNPPDRILVGLQLNFYVTELAVKHDAGRAEGKTLYLSFPLLKQLSEDHVVAIIGHELGHFIGEDTKMTREFYPLRFKVHATMIAMARSGWVGWPSFQFLNFFSWCFGETERAASRERELLADRKAAELTSPKIAAEALIRLQVAAEAFQLGLKEAMKNPSKNPLDLPLQNIVLEKLAPETAFWQQLFEKKLPHPLDTHPTLLVRLESLGQTVGVAEAQAIALAPSESAYERWFSQRAGLFADLSQQANAAVAKMRARSEVVEADVQTDAGRQFLEQHFPEKKWQASASEFWVGVVALGILSALCLAGVVFINDLAARVIFTVLLSFSGLGFMLVLKQNRRRELILKADGLYYTGWLRPLLFRDLENISGRRHYSNIVLTFHLKTKQPPIRKYSLVRFPGKTLTFSLSGLGGKADTIAETIFKYFTRQTGQ